MRHDNNLASMQITIMTNYIEYQ